ncbi:hypothetical protein ACFYWP_23260 [Actinacidiphila glaucinigra]|uniref:8-oxoguanine DNA glycosylase OGG fold protein n=1 Tax=Actinacidiphila glaucinigra TaxID=235986 RepID=UPI0036AC6612
MTHPGPDLTSLALPPEGQAALALPRAQRIHAHTITVPVTWWNAALKSRGLPGGPITAPADGPGRNSISRAALFTMATAPLDSDEDVLRLLWHVLAWGSGSKLRNNHRRLDVIGEGTSTAAAALREAASLARTDPEAAYRRLFTGTRVRYLGPAFFTKYLYFAGGGSSEHPCVILDSQVAETLNKRCGWHSLRSGGNWPPETYQRYCTLLTRWAREETDRLGRHVCPDEIERWLFEN